MVMLNFFLYMHMFFDDVKHSQMFQVIELFIHVNP